MELRDFAADLELPKPSDEEELVFRRGTLRVPPAELRAEELFVLVGQGFCNRFPFQRIELLAPKETFRGLGLVLVAHAFHQHNDRIRIAVTPSGVSGVAPDQPKPTELRVDLEGYRRDTRPITRVVYEPVAYAYMPEIPAKHPWFPGSLPDDLHDLPSVSVGDEHGDEPRTGYSSMVYGFGSLEGTFRMAELLLNASQPENDRYEITLEGEDGFRGVAPQSAELRLSLPGSDTYLHWAVVSGDAPGPDGPSAARP